METDDVSVREQLFHNRVRETIVSNAEPTVSYYAYEPPPPANNVSRITVRKSPQLTLFISLYLAVARLLFLSCRLHVLLSQAITSLKSLKKVTITIEICSLPGLA